MPKIDQVLLDQTLEEAEPHRVSGWKQQDNPGAGTGICMGMCLEWIRRILWDEVPAFDTQQGGPVSAMWNPGDGTSRRTGRRLRQAQTHALVLRAQQRTEDVLRQTMEAFVDRTVLDDLREEGLVLPNLKPDTLQGLTDEQRAKVARARTLAESFAGRDLEEALALTQAYVAESYTEFQKLWREAARSGAISTRWPEHDFHRIGMTSLRVARVVPTRLVPGEDDRLVPQPVPADAIWTYVAENLGTDLPPRGCAVVSFFRRAAGGHDVALYRSADGRRLFYLDPNAGEFVFDHADPAALQRLFSGLWNAFYARVGFQAARWSGFTREG